MVRGFPERRVAQSTKMLRDDQSTEVPEVWITCELPGHCSRGPAGLSRQIKRAFSRSPPCCPGLDVCLSAGQGSRTPAVVLPGMFRRGPA